jgi:hypothetical protein
MIFKTSSKPLCKCKLRLTSKTLIAPMAFQRDTNVLGLVRDFLGESPLTFNLEIALLRMPSLSHFGIVTIATSWLFVVIALGAVILALLLRGNRLIGPGDYINWIALTIGIALACQTTWAIVLEGHGEHQADFTGNQVNILARVN